MEDQAQQPTAPQVKDPQLQQILKQLKILNFWIAFFGVSIIVTLALFGFLFFKLVTFVQSTNNQLTTIQQKTTETLDVKSQFCGSALFKDTSACKSE